MRPRLRAQRANGKSIQGVLCVSKYWYRSTAERPGSRSWKARAPRQKGGRGRARGRACPKSTADWRVAELYIERRGRRSIVGNIYKGRVDNVLAGMEAAFVDIGLEKNGFLHVDEIVTPDGKAQRRGRGRGRGGGPRISDLLKPKQEIVVQVTKDPIGTKGARLSMEVSIPGPLPRLRAGRRRRRRLAPAAGHGARAAAQARLRAEAEAAAALIIRTAAHGARKSDMERELQYLFRLHEVLQSRVEDSPASVDGLPGGRPARRGSCATCSRASSSAR